MDKVHLKKTQKTYFQWLNRTIFYSFNAPVFFYFHAFPKFAFIKTEWCLIQNKFLKKTRSASPRTFSNSIFELTMLSLNSTQKHSIFKFTNLHEIKNTVPWNPPTLRIHKVGKPPVNIFINKNVLYFRFKSFIVSMNILSPSFIYPLRLTS